MAPVLAMIWWWSFFLTTTVILSKASRALTLFFTWGYRLGVPFQVLTAAVLQLFLEVRQALGEPGIGLPRQLLAAP